MYKHTLALLGLSTSIAANAAIVDLGNITRDLNTGLDWLDVTETRGLSYNEVTAQLGAGGSLEGWRYATVAELDQLIINFGYSAIVLNCPYTSQHCDDNITNDSEIVENMINLLGDTYEAANRPQAAQADGALSTHGILGTQHIEFGKQDLATISDFEYQMRSNPLITEDRDDRVLSAHRAVGQADASSTWGSFLVQATPVPVPAAGWLFLSALGGLAGRKQWQKVTGES